MRQELGLGLAITLVLAAPAMADGTRYYHPEQGFTIDFPVGWLVRENFAGTLVFAYDPRTQARVNVCTDLLGLGATSESYGQLGMAAFEEMFSDFRSQEQGTTTVAGSPATWYVFSGRMGKISFSTLEYFVVRGGTGYAINCSADQKTFASVRKDLERIVGTFALDPLPDEPSEEETERVAL